MQRLESEDTHTERSVLQKGGSHVASGSGFVRKFDWTACWNCEEAIGRQLESLLPTPPSPFKRNLDKKTSTALTQSFAGSFI